MPQIRSAESKDGEGRTVYTSYRAYRGGFTGTGYRSFPTYEDAMDYASSNIVIRLDKVEVTVLWVDELMQ